MGGYSSAVRRVLRKLKFRGMAAKLCRRRPPPLSDKAMKGLSSKLTQKDDDPLGLTNGGLPLPVRGTFIHFARASPQHRTLLGHTAPPKVDLTAGWVQRAVEADAAAAGASTQNEVGLASTPSPMGITTFSTWCREMLGVARPAYPCAQVSEIAPS